MPDEKYRWEDQTENARIVKNGGALISIERKVDINKLKQCNQQT